MYYTTSGYFTIPASGPIRGDKDVLNSEGKKMGAKKGDVKRRGIIPDKVRRTRMSSISIQGGEGGI